VRLVHTLWYTVLTRPRAILATTAGLLLFGGFSAARLPVEYLPRIEVPAVRIVTEHAGIGAAEVEQLLTTPVENALASVSGVNRIESVSMHGTSLVTVRFSWGANINRAVVEVREQLDAVLPLLPRGARSPLVFRDDLSLRPVAVLAAVPNESSDHTPDTALIETTRAVEHDLAAEIRRLPGIGRVDVHGAVRPELRVSVDPESAAAAGLGMPRIATAIAEAVVDLPVGWLRNGDKEYPLRVQSGVNSAADLQALRIEGTRLGAIASVEAGVEDRTTFFRSATADAVGLVVYPRPELGALAAAASLREELPRLADEFHHTFALELVEDNAEPVRRALRDLFVALAVGIGAAAGVLFGLQRSPAAALVCAAVIPVTLCLTAGVLFLAGVTLNLVSLAGVAIGIGMVLDNAIVVVDRLQSGQTPQIGASVQALSECAVSTFGGTATTILVFFPIALVPGPVGAVFGELALTVSILLALSYVVSLTFVPAALVSARELTQRRTQAARLTPRWVNFEQRYRCVLHTVIRRRRIAPAVMLLIAGGAAFLFGTREQTLFARAGEHDYLLELQFPRDLHLSAMREHAADAAREIASLTGVTVRHLSAGVDRPRVTDRLSAGGRDRLVTMALTVTPTGSARLTGNVRAGLRHVPFRNYRLAPAENPIETLLGGRSANTLLVRAENRAALQTAVSTLASALGELSATDAAAAGLHPLTEPAYALVPDFAALQRAGAAPRTLLTTLRHAVRGAVVAHLQDRGGELPIRVTLPEALRTPDEALRTLRVQAADERLVPLRAVAQLHRRRSPVALQRVDRRPAQTLTVEAASQPAAGNTEAWNAIDRLRLDSAQVEPTERGALRETKREMIWVFSLALMLLYMLLAAQLDSFLLPLLVLAVVPCYAFGGLAALAATSTPLSISSLLGLLVLLGTAVNGAILLSVGYRRGQSHRVNETVYASVVDESARRSRPAFAAFATTVTALAPLTLGPFAANVLIRDTTVPLVGGLVIGTAATLLLFPSLYLLFFPGTPAP